MVFLRHFKVKWALISFTKVEFSGIIPKVTESNKSNFNYKSCFISWFLLGGGGGHTSVCTRFTFPVVQNNLKCSQGILIGRGVSTEFVFPSLLILSATWTQTLQVFASFFIQGILVSWSLDMSIHLLRSLFSCLTFLFPSRDSCLRLTTLQSGRTKPARDGWRELGVQNYIWVMIKF